MKNLAKPRKVALVTGASSGIGKEIAKKLISDGLKVYVAARRLEKMDDLKLLGAVPLKMDITQDDQIIAALEVITKNDDSLDVLVNNAGFGAYGAMEDTTIADAKYQFEVNLFGLARLTQLVLPGMRAQKSGTIVNMSSMGGKIYTPFGAWYHATKHALEGWSDCLRLEVKPFGIDVVTIQPGAILTEFGDVMIGPMMERSGKTAYADVAKKVETITKETYAKGASHPSVIANAVSKAVAARRPKTRYVAGKLAKPLIFLRKWFGDRIFDKAVMSY